MVPDVRDAVTVDGVHVAYQVVGDGEVDLVYAPPFIGHLEVFWEEPLMARWLSRLARFSRLIVFDKRGTGLSDRVGTDSVPTLEERYPCAVQNDEFPEGWLPSDVVEEDLAQTERVWTEGVLDAIPEGLVEGLSEQEQARVNRWWARLCRMSVSPGAAVALTKMAYEIDIRHVLPSIRVPTLALCR